MKTLLLWLSMVGIILTCSTCKAGSSPSALLLREIDRHAVRVRVDGAFGSGIVVRVDPDSALVLTAAHVVDKEIVVLVDVDIEGLPIKKFPGLVDKVDTKLDLALIHVLGKLPRTAAPLAMLEPEDYDELYIVASPIGIQRQAFVERLNTKDAISRSSGHQKLWSVSGAMIPGMSGGGIFNGLGQLVAIVHSAAAYPGKDDDDAQVETAFGFAVPLTSIREFLKGIRL